MTESILVYFSDYIATQRIFSFFGKVFSEGKRLLWIIVYAPEICAGPNDSFFVPAKIVNCIVGNGVGVVVFLVKVDRFSRNHVVNKNARFGSDPAFIR